MHLVFSAINDIDASGVEAIESMHKGLCGDGIDLYFSNVKKQVWDVLEGADFLNTVDKSISLPQTLLAFLNSSKATLAFDFSISECHKTTGSNVY